MLKKILWNEKVVKQIIDKEIRTYYLFNMPLILF